MRILILLLILFTIGMHARADTPGHHVPEAFAGLSKDHYVPIDAQALRRQWSEKTRMVLPRGQSLSPTKLQQTTHPNGDVSLSGFDDQNQQTLNLTLGPDVAFGEIRGPGGHYVVTTDQTGSWMVKLPETGISYNRCGMEHDHATGNMDSSKNRQMPISGQQSEGGETIDLLIIYNRAFALRYPGDVLETRLNHLVHIANRIMANSEIDLQLQLAGHQRFDYPNFKSNLDFRNDIALTLDGNQRPGLEGLSSLRNSLGADLVIGFRPHDIEKRGNCGIAFFPENNPNRGVNVVSDGMSSWSVCLDDTMTHEIGHNLGAAHQIGQGGGFPDQRGSAFIRPGQFSTVMSSFGTGRPDRFRGLPIFSNPQVSCGNQSCGIFLSADNASVIRDFAPVVSAYRNNIVGPPPVAGPVPTPAPDSDGDGQSDWTDSFPFDPTEQIDSDLDGVGNNQDAFAFSSAEQTDTDGDGTGNNADTDDDGDGVLDTSDSFPLNSNESSDTDGDGRGDNSDEFPGLAAEQDDLDGDTVGNHADPDDDNDSVPEFDPQAEDLLVISTGNNRVLRYDAQTGRARGIEITGDAALLTFQSDLVYRQADHSLLYTAGSAVRRLDLLNREELGIWVPAYDDSAVAAPELGTGFPTGIALLDDQLAVTRQGNAQIALFAGQEQARNSSDSRPLLGADTRPLDITSDGDTAWVLVRNQRSLYRINAQGSSLLAGPGLAWMQDPRRMVITGDGRLLISDAKRKSVVAVDAQSGLFLGDLFDLAAAGHSSPDGMVQLADGTVLVAAPHEDTILAFDPEDGSFLGERIPAGSEGLSEPRAMTLVPALQDYVGNDPERTFRPNSGLWSNPATDGRGFDIQVSGPRLSVVWYTYDDQGHPIWYLAAGKLNQRIFDQPLLRFNRNGEGLASETVVGSLRLEFEDARVAHLQFDVDGAVGSESLLWQRFSPDAANPDHTAVWGRVDGPGWGLSMARQGGTSIAVAYIYDAAGVPRWLISKPSVGPAPSQFEMQASFGLGLCPACQGPSSFQFQDAGEMAISLPGTTAASTGSWSSEVTLPAPLAGNWMLEATPLIRFTDTPERPR